MSIAEIEAREVELEPSSGLWSDAWRRLRRNPGAIVGFVLVSVFITVALFAPLIAPEDPRVGRISTGSKAPAAPVPRPSISSASTSRAATSSRGSSTVRATRC